MWPSFLSRKYPAAVAANTSKRMPKICMAAGQPLASPSETLGRVEVEWPVLSRHVKMGVKSTHRKFLPQKYPRPTSFCTAQKPPKWQTSTRRQLSIQSLNTLSQLTHPKMRQAPVTCKTLKFLIQKVKHTNFLTGDLCAPSLCQCYFCVARKSAARKASQRTNPYTWLATRVYRYTWRLR